MEYDSNRCGSRHRHSVTDWIENIFIIVDQDEITLTSVHHNIYFEVANVDVGMGGGFVNTKEL
jgi:hypothetical protein